MPSTGLRRSQRVTDLVQLVGAENVEAVYHLPSFLTASPGLDTPFASPSPPMPGAHNMHHGRILPLHAAASMGQVGHQNYGAIGDRSINTALGNIHLLDDELRIEAVIEVEEPSYFIRAHRPRINYNRAHVELQHPRPQRLWGSPKYAALLSAKLDDTLAAARAREAERCVQEPMSPVSVFGNSMVFVGERPVPTAPPASPASTIPNNEFHTFVAPQVQPVAPMPRWAQLATPSPISFAPPTEGTYTAVQSSTSGSDAGRPINHWVWESQSTSTRSAQSGVAVPSSYPILVSGRHRIIYVPRPPHPPAPAPTPDHIIAAASRGAPYPAIRVPSPVFIEDDESGSESAQARDYIPIPDSDSEASLFFTPIPSRPIDIPARAQTSAFEAIRASSQSSSEDLAATISSWRSGVPTLINSSSTNTLSSVPTIGSTRSATPALNAVEQGIMKMATYGSKAEDEGVEGAKGQGEATKSKAELWLAKMFGRLMKGKPSTKDAADLV